MTKHCRSKTRAGAPCPNSPGVSGYCFIHDPAKGTERAAARRRGGQHRRAVRVADVSSVPSSIRTVGDVLKLLDVATLDTLALENSVARTRAIVGIVLGYLKALEVGEIEARLTALEAAIQEHKP